MRFIYCFATALALTIAPPVTAAPLAFSLDTTGLAGVGARFALDLIDGTTATNSIRLSNLTLDGVAVPLGAGAEFEVLEDTSFLNSLGYDLTLGDRIEFTLEDAATAPPLPGEFPDSLTLYLLDNLGLPLLFTDDPLGANSLLQWDLGLAATPTIYSDRLAPGRSEPACGSYFGSQVGAGRCIARGTLTIDQANQHIVGALALGNAGGSIDTNGNSATVSGVIGGAGSLTKNGQGTLILTGGNTYLGGTIVNQGTLSVLGTLASGIVVNPGGTVRGIGRIGGGILVGGQLAPGNSPGTLTFAGPVVMAPGGTLRIEIDGAGQGNGAGNYSRVAVEGADNTFVAAGILEPVLSGIVGDATNAYTPAIGQSFTIVTAAAGVIGTFDGLTPPMSGLAAGTRFDALYDPHTVRLAVTPAAYASLPSVALSGNALSVGGALDAARPAAYARKNALFQSLAILPESQVAEVLQQLSGEIYPDLVAASFKVHRLPRQTIFGRLNDLRAGRRTPGVAVPATESEGALAGRLAGGVAQALETVPNQRFWVQGIGGRVVTDSDAHATQMDEHIYGVAAGGDMPIGNRLQVGMALTYGQDRVDANQNGAGKISTWQAIAYGLWEQSDCFANLALGYGWDDYSTNRWVTFPSAGNLSADSGGSSEFVDIELGLHRWWDVYLVEPTARVLADFLRRDRAGESGLAGLSVDGQSYQATQSRLGARVSREFRIGSNIRVTPELRGYWLHDFGDAVSVATDAAILGQPFVARAPGVDRDAVLLGLGVAADAGKNAAFFLDYNLTYNSSQTGQDLLAGLLIRW